MTRSTRKFAVAATVTLAVTILIVACASAPVAAPAPQASISGSGKTLFYDDFNNVKGEWQMAGGIWETLTPPGHAVQRTDDARQLNAIRWVTTPRVNDATIETTVRVNPVRPATMTDSPEDRELLRNIRYIIGAGIIFRMKDPRNYYMFRLAGEEGAVIGKMVDGVWADLDNPRVRQIGEGTRLGFRADNWYRLRVEAYGDRIIAYVNDEPVSDVRDNTFSIGHVGIVTFKTAADFDVLNVYNRQEGQVKTP